jgi:transposase, IS5 family
MGFADLMVSQGKGKASFLDDVDRLVDWRPIEKILHRTYKKCVRVGSLITIFDS